MFTKNSQILGKSFLSAKDSKSFRELLLSSHSVKSISKLWVENANLLLQRNEESNSENNNSQQQIEMKCKNLLLEWLGIFNNSSTCSFTAEIIQGVVKGSSSENSKKVLLGCWSLKNDSASFPIAFSILPEGTSTAKLGLPPGADDDDDAMTLSLQSLIRLAQLWQLALAAAFIDHHNDEGEEEDNGNEQEQNKKKKNKKNEEEEGSEDDENEDDEEESDDDDDDASSSDFSKSQKSSSSSPFSPPSIIFQLSSLLFPKNKENSERVKSLIHQSLDFHRSQGADNLQIFPAVLCHAEVSDNIFRGSDLMVPGTFYQPRMVKYLKPGALTYIVPFGHYLPISIGTLDENIQLTSSVAPQNVISADMLRQQLLSSKISSSSSEEQNNNDVDNNNNNNIETLIQTKMLEFNLKSHFAPRRSSMSPASTETKSVKVITSLGDLFWKSVEVNFAKSSSLLKMTVFATNGGKLVQEEKSSVVMLMGQLVSSSSSSSKKNGNKNTQNKNDDVSESSDEDEEEENSKKKKNNNNKKPIPKNKIKKGSAATAGKKNQQQKQQAPSASSSSQQKQKEEQQHFILLRWLLSECSPSPWPPGVVLSVPPKIIIPTEDDDKDDDEDDEEENNSVKQTKNRNQFSKNDPSAFASIVYKFVSALKTEQEKLSDSTSSPTTAQESSSNAADHNNANNNNNNQRSLTEEILLAATFVALSSITKDQLPFPLSQFGAKLQDHLPSINNNNNNNNCNLLGNNNVSSLDWSNTKWKKPINLLREYAKPSKNFNNNNNDSKKKNIGSNKQKQQQDCVEESSSIDLANDWCVELVEQGPGNFVIQSINKSSKVFRDHKKSTDVIHELVREENNKKSNNNDDDDNNVDNNNNTFYDSQTQGKFLEISTGFVSQRSGLTGELDVVVFGDPKLAQKLTAAVTEAREQEKFPSLLGNTTPTPTPAASTAAASATEKIHLDDFVSVEEAKRRVSQYARSCGFVVTKQDAVPNSTTAAPNAKPGDLKIQGALKGLYGNSPPLSSSLDDLMKKVSIQVQKGTLLRFQNGHSEIRRGNPPLLTLSAKQVHNHWVTTLTGHFGYYLDVNLASDIIKKKLACSARVEDAPATKTQSKNSLSLVLSGRHVEDFLNLLKEEFGVDKELIQLVNVAQRKK